MRILNVVEALAPGYGGTVERTVGMSRALKSLGHEVTVLTVGPVTHPAALDGSIGTVVSLPLLNARYGIPWPSPATISRVMTSVDVVHIMSHWPPLNAAAFIAAQWKAKPYVVTPAGSLRVYGRSQRLKHLFNVAIGTRMLRGAARIILITGDEADAVAAHGVDRSRLEIVPNAVDADAFTDTDVTRFREQYQLGVDPLILFLGRLNEIKGPDLLLDGFLRDERLRTRSRLVFAGPDGGLLAGLRARAEESPAKDRVHFIGVLGGDWKSRALHAASILAVPSRHEAMSIVALEAGVTGTPVVLSDQCGFDAVEAIGGGRVVPPNAEAIANALALMLDDPSALAAMGHRLQDYVVANCSWRSVGNRLEGILENSCER